MLKMLLALVASLVFAPPSGRPPIMPLDRYEPRIYDIQFEVTLSATPQRNAGQQQIFVLKDTPIMMPIIFQGTYSRVDERSVAGRLWLGSQEVPFEGRTDDGLPFHEHLAVMPIAEYQGQTLRWQIGYRVQVWSSRIVSEAAMAQATWPREWPDEVQDGLKPQMFIESGHDLFKQAVADASGDQLRLVSPYIAAKEIVRYCTNKVQPSGDGQAKGNLGALEGLELTGALAAAKKGLGTPHDLVCVCIATLRAAGIPARPVIGIREEIHRAQDPDRPRPRQRTEFVSWGEFYLNDIGWVPFDPNEMRKSGIRTLPIERPWRGFAAIEDLNERIPLSYHFIPPVTAQSPQAATAFATPAVWGWDPRPAPPTYGTEQAIKLNVNSRGKGIDDDLR